MKRKLGVSVYPDHSDIERDREYLQQAAGHGFSRIFMSMLEVTEDKDAVVKKFKDLIGFAKGIGYEIILDVAPNIFDDLGISYDDMGFFHDLGADAIRLDVGFDGSKEAMLTYNPYGVAIELNMSNDVAYLDNILTYQANKPYLYGCHNFYPQDGTALPYEFFEKCSIRFREQGIRTAAFITSQAGNIGPWDINDGLPTLECHRYLPVVAQAKHLWASGYVDDVIIGNAYASEEELKALGEINRYQLELTLDLVEVVNPVEETIAFGQQHYRRGDITSRMARSTEVRKVFKHDPNPPHDHKIMFQRGDVVIGNDGFGKYKNELQVILEPHEDSRKNKIGSIAPEEMILLDFILPWTKFRFKKGRCD
ncbi:MAG: MupG family TIM beta-alpha barrel fold protein [Turicibacter sp.]|nr:MupG family TIM beta-alpha barrel fold protein [Turicibacter sp.]